MNIQKPVAVAIIMVAFLGVCSVGAWAEPVPLTDAEMDEIFAQGIFVDLSINIAMPNGSNLVMPGFEVPFPDMPRLSGNSSDGVSGAISVAPVTPVSNTATAPGNTATTPSNTNAANSSSANSSQATTPTVSAPASNTTGTPNTVIMPTAAAVSVGNNSMNDNSGLFINAPKAAISILLNVAVFNNSTLNGDFMQSARSDVRTFSFSFSSFNF